VHTEANAVTTGTSSDAGGRTLVSGTKIGGQDATVDENGVRFTDPATAPIGEQVLSNVGISMYVTAPRQDPKTSTSSSYKSGSLVVIWDPPGTDYGYIYEVCGSDASVELRTGLAFVPVPVPDFSPDLPPVDTPSELGDAGFADSSLVGPVPTPTASSPARKAAPPASIGPVPVGFVRDLSIVPYLIGLLSVVVAGLGLGRAREAALAPRAAAVACPLEGARS